MQVQLDVPAELNSYQDPLAMHLQVAVQCAQHSLVRLLLIVNP